MPKKYEVRFAEAARRDLRQIAAYLLENASPETAREVVLELRELAESLGTFAERGNVPKELQQEGIAEFRQLVRNPYRVFYNLSGNRVTILMIADGRRDMQELLRRRLLSR